MAQVVQERNGLRVEKVVTSGIFALDGGEWEVENNVWIVGNDTECAVIDAAHDATPILAAIGQRTVTAILCTHGHNDHINAVLALREATGAPAYLHPADRMLWDQELSIAPDRELADGDRIEIAGTAVQVLHTPGHSPGACCLWAADAELVFSGDTLFNGGPGATGRSYSDFDTIIDSIRRRLLSLPKQTTVLTGHGESTTIGAEAPQLAEWIERGH